MRSTVFLLLLSAPCAAQIVLGGNAGGYIGGNGSQTNDPVTMVFEHKQVQTLVDGTHISHTTHETFYRDTLGRTRNDHEAQMFGMAGSSPMRSVNVQDPVAQTSTHWQAGGLGNLPHEYFRTSTNRTFPQGQGAVPPTPRQRTTPLPAPAEKRPRPQNTTEQLGPQDVQGVPCEAVRTTTVYPIDFMGNDRPITSTNEYCHSKEFGRNLRESMDDPRTGTNTTTLQSISRGEPDPSLFQPPPDYTERPQQH